VAGRSPNPERVYCSDCLLPYQAEQYTTAFHGSGLAVIEQAKAKGNDPTHGADAAVARAASSIERKREVREWDERYRKLIDLSAFKRDVLPLIQGVPVSRLQRATGLSLRYVSQIRRGEKTPHPRHRPALVATADYEDGASQTPRPPAWFSRSGSGTPGSGVARSRSAQLPSGHA
jgi:hypothetical protein